MVTIKGPITIGKGNISKELLEHIKLPFTGSGIKVSKNEGLIPDEMKVKEVKEKEKKEVKKTKKSKK